LKEKRGKKGVNANKGTISCIVDKQHGGVNPHKAEQKKVEKEGVHRHFGYWPLENRLHEAFEK